MDPIFSDELFEKITAPLQKGEYEACTFKHCDFSRADLSGFLFIDCEFFHCNLSLARLLKTTFNDVKFKDCKIIGIHLENCNEFGLSVDFENCILDHSSFYKMKLKKTSFRHTQLREVDLTDADLTAAIFHNCDLTGAKFENTILEKADFRTAFNYAIDPEASKIKKAKFSRAGLEGLLTKYDIDITD